MEDLLTTQQVADELGIGYGSMRALVSNHKITPASGNGPQNWRFTRASVQKRLEAVAEAKIRQRPSPSGRYGSR